MQHEVCRVLLLVLLLRLRCCYYDRLLLHHLLLRWLRYKLQGLLLDSSRLKLLWLHLLLCLLLLWLDDLNRCLCLLDCVERFCDLAQDVHDLHLLLVVLVCGVPHCLDNLLLLGL